MHSVIYLAFAMMFFHKNKCSYILNNHKIDQISNNIEMLVKPIKLISDIFPNHEFEVQFNLDHMDYDRPSIPIYHKDPSRAIMRSNIVPKAATTTTPEDSAPDSKDITLDPSNPVVHMKDLKNALEEHEKTHATEHCNKKDLTTKSPILLSNFNDKPALSEVLQLIKRGAKLQNDLPKPGDSDLSWIKIRVPTA